MFTVVTDVDVVTLTVKQTYSFLLSVMCKIDNARTGS